MISYKDKAFCGTIGCQNKCGRKMTKAEEEQVRKLDIPVAYAFFCNTNGEVKCLH